MWGVSPTVRNIIGQKHYQDGSLLVAVALNWNDTLMNVIRFVLNDVESSGNVRFSDFSTDKWKSKISHNFQSKL